MPPIPMNTVEEVLNELVATTREAFGNNLQSVVLFGSAAEQRLSPTSDVNLMIVLDHFDTAQADACRESLRAAAASIRAKAMFVLAAELPVAAQLFSLKFHDIQSRHRVLYGSDPLVGLVIDREELKRRLREVLLNFVLRLRERYVATSLREESLQVALAEAAGPLRTAAAALRQLQGQASLPPRAALEKLAASADNQNYISAVATLSQARREALLPPGQAKSALLALMDLATQMRTQLEAAA